MRIDWTVTAVIVLIVAAFCLLGYGDYRQQKWLNEHHCVEISHELRGKITHNIYVCDGGMIDDED